MAVRRLARAFYPRGCPSGPGSRTTPREFATVEVNNAFYRLPERSVFDRWRDRDARRVRRGGEGQPLPHPHPAAARPGGAGRPPRRPGRRASATGSGPYLLQLPPNLRADAGALDACLRRVPVGVRVAVEPRHESWWTDEVRAVLERRGAALCWADRRGRPITPLWRTADVGLRPPPRGHGLAPARRTGAPPSRSWLDRIDDALARRPPGRRVRLLQQRPRRGARSATPAPCGGWRSGGGSRWADSRDRKLGRRWSVLDDRRRSDEGVVAPDRIEDAGSHPTITTVASSVPAATRLVVPETTTSTVCTDRERLDHARNDLLLPARATGTDRAGRPGAAVHRDGGDAGGHDHCDGGAVDGVRPTVLG